MKKVSVSRSYYVTMGISMFLFISAVPVANIVPTFIRMDFLMNVNLAIYILHTYIKGSK